MSKYPCEGMKKMFRDGTIPDDILLAVGKVIKIADTQVLAGQGDAVASPAAQTQGAIAITYTANDPSITPDGAVTVANGSSPTVAELLELAVELIAELAKVKTDLAAVRTSHIAALAALRTHGLIATA